MSYDTTIEETEFQGTMKCRYAVVDVDSYNNGGEDLTPNDVGLSRFQSVEVYVRDGSPYIAQYDEETRTLLIRGDGDGSSEDLPEVADGTGPVSVRFVGKGK